MPKASIGQKTMLGIGVGTAAAVDPHKTMLGVGGGAPAGPAGPVSPTWPDAPVQQPAQVGGASPTWSGNPGAGQTPGQPLQQTMLGFGPLAPAQGEPAGPVTAPQPGLQKTMLGIAPEPPVQAAAAPATGLQKTAPGIAPGPPPAAKPPSNALPSQQKTMLGIAHPGIAPLDPTANKKPAQRAPAPPPPRAAVPVPAPSPAELSVHPGHRPRRVPLVALLAIGGFVVLLVGAAVVALVWKSSGPVSAKVTLDQQSHEQLELGCPQCPDGTRVELGKASTAFQKGHAVLPVDRPLSMGDNKLELTLTRPGADHSTTVDLTVPVDYRVHGDLSTLSGNPPKLTVNVQAEKGSKVSVDGKPLELAADGTAHLGVDVTKELSGAAASVRPLERKVSYSVLPPGAKTPDRGEIKFQLGIVPLVIDAPGPRIVTDARSFMLAGHTAKGGTVSVGGRSIAVDAKGSFAQLMNIKAVGQTTINVRASAKDRAPRLFPLHVKRVKSLRDEAAVFGKNATKSYADISTAIDSKKGRAVALAGTVVEARMDHHRSYVLFDVSDGCKHGPCLARLVYGEGTHFAKGDQVTAYGHVTRGVDGPRKGSTIPEVEVDFFLKGSSP